MPKLRNVNPLGHIDVPILRREGEPVGEEGVGCLEPGEVFETTAAIAGRAPSDDDPGEGLLAQVDNYELVQDKPAVKTAKREG